MQMKLLWSVSCQGRDLGADSLSAVELIMALEDNGFDIKISDEEMKVDINCRGSCKLVSTRT